MKALQYVALVLVIVGAVNWGLYGAFGLDLVKALFGELSLLSRIVYILVGVAGLSVTTLFPLIDHGHRRIVATA